MWEWCLNEYENTRSVSLETGVSRVLRGGSWANDPRSCRAAARYSFDPDARIVNVGFRVCCASPIE